MMLFPLPFARLNISQSATPSKQAQRRGTPVSTSRKRKRAAMESSIALASSSSDYRASSAAKTPLEVQETDTDGQFIKLHNSGNKVCNSTT